MCELENNFFDEIATHCIEKYSMLPKTGKPIPDEWTVLSCVVQYSSTDNRIMEVASLGTGSKCIGAAKMSSSGDILNDSHAEVIARRGFLVYLYENISKAFENQPSIFTIHNGKCKLKETIQFAFYSSQLPCGDAAIVPKADSDLFGDVLKSHTSKRPADTELCNITSKLGKYEKGADIHRTGAKCLSEAPQDTHESGSSYHLLGQVRTKPGRGDRTLSVSCSDKMARWIHVGIQGALLDMLLEEPIFISKFVFGGGVPYSDESLRRALLERNCTYNTHKWPSLHQSCIVFPHIRSISASRPAAGSILWVKTTTPILEVAVLGKKLGVTKKTKNAACSQLSISKYSLYKKFLHLVNLHNLLSNFSNCEHIKNLTYTEMKKKSLRYLDEWNKLKNIFFGTWTKKGDIWTFTVQPE